MENTQSLKYTYFCHTRKVYTWIDHILSTDMDASNIVSCKIRDHDHGNVSDHLPLQLVTTVYLHEQKLHNNKDTSRYHLQWDNNENNVRYYNLVKEKLGGIELPVCTQDNAEHATTELLDKITEVLHNCARLAGCAVLKRFNPKPWWCPHLTQLRDKKKFWWNIWVCNGRPRDGVVFECWKGVKKLFRKYARSYSQSKVNTHCGKLNKLYLGRQQSSFWSMLKRQQSLTVTSSLTAEQFANHYSSIMTDDGHLTPRQKHITDLVCNHYENVCKSAFSDSFSITSNQVSEFIKLLKKGCSPGVDGVTSEHLYYANSEVLCRYHQVVLSNSL